MVPARALPLVGTPREGGGTTWSRVGTLCTFFPLAVYGDEWFQRGADRDERQEGKAWSGRPGGRRGSRARGAYRRTPARRHAQSAGLGRRVRSSDQPVARAAVEGAMTQRCLRSPSVNFADCESPLPGVTFEQPGRRCYAPRRVSDGSVRPSLPARGPCSLDPVRMSPLLFLLAQRESGLGRGPSVAVGYLSLRRYAQRRLVDEGKCRGPLL